MCYKGSDSSQLDTQGYIRKRSDCLCFEKILMHLCHPQARILVCGDASWKYFCSERSVQCQLQRIVICCLLAPKDLGLDIISDPVITVEIPRQSERLFHLVSKFPSGMELMSSMKKIATKATAENPCTQLRSFDFWWKQTWFIPNDSTYRT